MGAMSEWELERREPNYGRGARIEIAGTGELTWSDVEAISEGALGEFCIPCPYCGSGKWSSRRFKLTRNSLGAAEYRCFYCGVSGELSNDELADPEREAVAREAAAKRKAEKQAERQARAFRLWDEAVPLPGTIAADYLAARAIGDLPPQADEVLRFHPRCEFGWDEDRRDWSRVPCMVALMRDVKSDAARAIHRTWIGAGTDKALGKMTLGPTGGAAIKLWRAKNGGRLVVGEGIETVLSGAFYVKHDGAILQPAWALGTAFNLQALPVIRRFKELVILADNDPNGVGQTAARVCSDRWSYGGRFVHTLKPRTVKDFNDEIRGERS